MVYNDSKLSFHWFILQSASQQECLFKIDQSHTRNKEISRKYQNYSQTDEKTYDQVKQIGGLTDNWVKTMSDRMEKIKSIRQRKREKENELVKVKQQQVKLQKVGFQNNKMQQGQLKQQAIVEQTISEPLA